MNQVGSLLFRSNTIVPLRDSNHKDLHLLHCDRHTELVFPTKILPVQHLGL